jgi:adenosylcobinamide amidohydrolase
MNAADPLLRPGSDFFIECLPGMLICRLAERHRVLSWAITGGGFGEARAVVWCHVTAADLRPPVDPATLLRERLAGAGLPDAVGLLTSRRLETYIDVTKTHEDTSARCVATVGLSNSLRAGDAPGTPSTFGTINLLCRLSHPLTDEGMIEALAIAAEAKTLAIVESGVSSRVSERAASGTGTDCIVMAAPLGGDLLPYAGKHAAAGCVIGGAVEEAIRRGAAEWKQAREKQAP